MNIDYIIENDLVIVRKSETVKDKAKKTRLTRNSAKENLRKMMFDRLCDKTGDC